MTELNLQEKLTTYSFKLNFFLETYKSCLEGRLNSLEANLLPNLVSIDDLLKESLDIVPSTPLNDQKKHRGDEKLNKA